MPITKNMFNDPPNNNKLSNHLLDLYFGIVSPHSVRLSVGIIMFSV